MRVELSSVRTLSAGGGASVACMPTECVKASASAHHHGVHRACYSYHWHTLPLAYEYGEKVNKNLQWIPLKHTLKVFTCPWTLNVKNRHNIPSSNYKEHQRERNQVKKTPSYKTLMHKSKLLLTGDKNFKLLFHDWCLVDSYLMESHLLRAADLCRKYFETSRAAIQPNSQLTPWCPAIAVADKSSPEGKRGSIDSDGCQWCLCPTRSPSMRR